MTPTKCTLLAALSALALLAPLAPARADDASRLSVLEENDSLFFNSDKHYTQGARISYLAPDLAKDSDWNDWYNLAGHIPFVFVPGDGDKRRYSLILGQSIFTPKNLTLKLPSAHDRPYGGWLYVGASLLQETPLAGASSMLENVEVDAGAVGPVSLGEQIQNNFHQFIGDDAAKGWASQIQNEPGVLVSYERLWRLPLLGDGYDGVDIVPQAGLTAGNVFTYGDVGGLVRIGHNLHADYGPVRIRPALSGTDYFDASQIRGNWGYYFFAGAQGRVVGQNIFLDGNSFRTSPHTDKKPLVADFQAGFSVIWPYNDFRTDFSVVRRTEEFAGQSSPDEICTAAIAFSW